MVLSRSQSSRLLSSLSSAWAGEWDLLINHHKCSCLIVGNLPPLSPSFSATDANHRIPDARVLGVPLDTTFTSSNHCKEAVIAARRLFQGCTELSKSAFIPLYCAIVQPHLEYAMEANARTLRVDINKLGRVPLFSVIIVTPGDVCFPYP